MKSFLMIAAAMVLLCLTANDASAYGRGSPPGGHGGGHGGGHAAPVHAAPAVHQAPAVRYNPAARVAPANAVAAHHGVAVGPFGAVHSGNMYAPGTARHITQYISPNYYTMRGNAIRSSYPYASNYFNRRWYASHPNAWNGGRFISPYSYGGGGLGALAGFLGMGSLLGGYGGFGGGLGGFGGGLGGIGSRLAGGGLMNYGYGSNIVYQGDNVYIDGENAATADAFAASAQAIADAGRNAQVPADEEWQPLGVFGLVQGEEKVATHMLQLAANKDGILRGNYYDSVADTNLPVYGSIDKKTQRVSWSIGDKKDVVYEAGFGNLMQSEAPVLIHYGKERTQQLLLVRLEDKDAAQTATK